MKGIILAGGSGTRLYPVTSVISKQLLPIYDKPMVYYPLSVLMLAGIRDILIISTPRDTPKFIELFGRGEDLGVKISYIEQPSPDGLAQAFILGERFIGTDPVCLVLGDNIFYGDGLSNLVLRSKKNVLSKKQAIVFGYNVKNPNHYGVVSFDNDGKVNLWDSNYDVIGSVANYFKKNGWQSHDNIMSPISYSKSDLSNVEKASKQTYKPSTKYSEYKKDLILSDEPMKSDIYLAVIGRKESQRKEYSFGHKNFYVITRYNRSRLYALAVYYLSEEIKIAKSKI